MALPAGLREKAESQVKGKCFCDLIIFFSEKLRLIQAGVL